MTGVFSSMCQRSLRERGKILDHTVGVVNFEGSPQAAESGPGLRAREESVAAWNQD
jgi:hypothetical protein